MRIVRRQFHERLFNYLTLVVAFSIPISARLTTVCIIVLAFNWLWEGEVIKKLRTAWQHPFFIWCMLFYAWELCGMLYSRHAGASFYHAQTESSFLVLPLLYLGRETGDTTLRRRAMDAFSASVLLASAYCIVHGLVGYEKTKDSSLLFYHTLVAPIHQHAVYFSLYTLLVMVWLSLRLGRTFRNPSRLILLMVLLAYLGMLLFLLRSKMLVGIACLFGLYGIIGSLIQKPVSRPRLAGCAVVTAVLLVSLFTSNPLSRQYAKLTTSDVRVLQSQPFSRADYFDEVELRLLLWKFSMQILQESHRWLVGVGPGDARYRMNEEVTAHDLYTGIPGTEDKGYLNYNNHNQYMETLFRSGVLGLCLLLGVLGSVFRLAGKRSDTLLMALVLSCAVVFLTESVLERQIGIVPFFFFVSLFIRSPDLSPEIHSVKRYEKKMQVIC